MDQYEWIRSGPDHLVFTCLEPGTAFWMGWSSSYIEGYTKSTGLTVTRFEDPWLNSHCSTSWSWFNTNQSWICFESYQSFWFNFNGLLNTIRCGFYRLLIELFQVHLDANDSKSNRGWRKRVVYPKKRTLLTEFGCKFPHIFLESSITIALTVSFAAPKFTAFYRVLTLCQGDPIETGYTAPWVSHGSVTLIESLWRHLWSILKILIHLETW